MRKISFDYFAEAFRKHVGEAVTDVKVERYLQEGIVITYTRNGEVIKDIHRVFLRDFSPEFRKEVGIKTAPVAEENLRIWFNENY